MLEKLSLCK